MGFLSRALKSDSTGAAPAPITEGATVVDQHVYPIPQDQQPHPVYGFDPRPVEDVAETPAEDHLADPDPVREHPE